MTTTRRLVAALLTAVVLIVLCSSPAATHELLQKSDGDANLYAPVKEDFRGEFDKDAANQKRQTWDQYWGWVESFYKGNLLDIGWTRRSTDAVTKVKDDKAKRRVRKELNSLGRLIAAEWAKDNAVRKIDTAELQGWAKRLVDAKNNDNGSGKTLSSEIAKVRGEADAELAK